MFQIEEYYSNLITHFANIAIWLFLIPVVIAIWRRNCLNGPLRLILLHLLFGIIFNVLAQLFIWSTYEHYYEFWEPILRRTQITDTNFLNVLPLLGDYLLIGWIFSFFIQPPYGRLIKRLSWCLIPITLLIYFLVDGFRNYGTVNAILNKTYLIVLPGIYFWFLVRSSPHLPLWKNPVFLFGLGLMLPSLLSFFLALTGEKLNNSDPVMFFQISIIRNCLIVLSQFLFAYAFYQAKYIKYLPKLV